MNQALSGKHIDSKSLFSLFKEFENYSLSYVYKGIFNPALTDRILSLAETNMNITGESSKTQKKVYFVMVESLQNITRHQDVNQTNENHAFFVVQNKVGEYDLSSGNIIERSKIDDLKEKLDKINSLNADELKVYAKDVLENTGLSEKGGAGLGLIEMARKSGNKLLYDFKSIDDKLSYFYFKSRVTAEPDTSSGEKAIEDVKQLHEFTRVNHINMIYLGIFTHDNLKSLLSMTEGSLVKPENIAFKRKAVNVMIELLQNICNHASSIDPNMEGKPGILVVSTNEKGCRIISGNYITNSTLPTLQSKIDKVNTSNEKELDDLYSEIIMREQEPGQKGAGLGFVDIRMKTGSQIEYTSVTVNENFSFISITVFIPF
jgi:coenzyme F420-reducing hydrogenase delta subunit